MKIHTLKNDHLELDVLTGKGPRVVSLRFHGSKNLFAEIPEKSIQTSFGDYHFIGGHRLWHSPESMPRTYIPDQDLLNFTPNLNSVLLDSKPEPETGIHKSIEIKLDAEKPSLTLRHVLLNEGLWPVELAPWAITMMKLGGTAIIPMAVGNADPHGLLPNRQISLWPYSRINDSRVDWNDDFVVFQARPSTPPFKLGSFNPMGWLAYWNEGILFRKVFEADHTLRYPDMNCNSELYGNDEFVELESLGPLSRLEPGGTVTHTETWEIYDSLDQQFIPSELIKSLL